MLRASLENRGTFTSAMEVSPDPQQADGYFVPDLSRSSPVTNTLLGRMTERPCSFEVFSASPEVLEVETCLRKHFNLRHILRKSKELSEGPHQWILCAGKPLSALDATWARQVADWPGGVYELSPVNATSIVVLSELPEERPTLFLRLMGRGRTLRRAVAELKTLSEDEFEKCIALPILVRYRIEAVDEPAQPADEEFIVNTQEIMDMYERRAELRGRLQGQRETVLRLLRRKFGPLPETVVTRIQNADAQWLELVEDRVLFAGSLDEVIAA